MTSATFVGLDVHADSITAAILIGARRSMVGSSIVTSNNIPYSIIKETTKIAGIDGEGIDAVEGRFSNIMIEDDVFTDVPFIIIVRNYMLRK